MLVEGFWTRKAEATRISKTADLLKKELNFWTSLDNRFADLLSLADLAEKDVKLYGEVLRDIENLEKEFADVRIKTFFSNKYDFSDVVLAIHAGAGGTDAQDWTEILLRMYLRYVEKKGWSTEIISKSEGTEAGIKSVVVEIKGEYAYGYLKNEAGVHRLVRQSPFNSTHTRETSFSLVEVLPIIAETEVKLDPKEIEMQTSTASGHGGQSVNTTYSAVKLKHIPTGITVSIQNQRSQFQNKEKAMEILRSRLTQFREKELLKEKQEIKGEFHSPEWGNQIRSYVMHPYQMVKDHRTNYETSDVTKVLDGDLDKFIEEELENKINS